MNDVDYMKVALGLALRAKGQTWPNPMVGALVVKNNRIIGRGFHKFCGGEHAEAIAIRHAGKKCQGAKLYVTLEPCSHFGRTPPCVDKIIQSGIKEVVIGMIDPNPVNNGKSVAKLKKSGIKVKAGFLKEELQKINEPFIKYVTQRMPFVVAKTGQTLDGKIATSRGESKWITGKEARRYTHRLRDDFGAILVGINTVLKDNPGLNGFKKSKRLKKIIVDSRLQIPLSAKLFSHTEPSDILIATTQKRNKTKEQALIKKGVSVLVCPSSKEGVDLRWLFKELAGREMVYVLMEGGSRIIGSALKEGLVDKFLIVIAPKVMGDERALGSVSGLQTRHLIQAVHLNNVTVRRLDKDILVEGYVYGNR